MKEEFAFAELMRRLGFQPVHRIRYIIQRKNLGRKVGKRFYIYTDKDVKVIWDELNKVN
jgi:3-hydroxyacyl-CoA dehydrogenase